MTYPLGGHGVVNYTRGIIYPSIFDSAVQLIDPSDLSTVNGISVDDPIVTIDCINGSGNDYTQGTAGDRPILRAGYMESVSSDFMSCGTGISKLAASTLMLVFAPDSTGLTQVPMGEGNTTGQAKGFGMDFQLRSDNTIRSRTSDGTSGHRSTEITGPYTTNTVAMSRRYPADSGDLVEIEVDGVAQSEIDYSGSTTSIGGTAYQMSIFKPGEATYSQFMEGKIYFIAVWDSRLNDTDMAIVSDYVNTRFGL
jgi:type 1 fimbria pilin